MTQVYPQLQAAGLALVLALGPVPLKAQTAADSDSLETALFNLALPHHPQLMSRRAALALAEGRLRAAGPLEAPTLSAEVENITDGIDLPNAGQIRLMLEREFLTGPRRSAERDVARAEVAGAAASVQLTEQGLRSTLKRDLAIWRGWLGVAARLSAEDSLLQEAETGLTARFASGEARYVDVLRLRTERLRIRSEWAEALRTSQTGVRRLEESVAADDAALSSLRAMLAASQTGVTGPLAVDVPAVPDPDSIMASMGTLSFARQRVDLARGLAARDRAARRLQVTGGLGIQRFAGDNGGFTVGPSLRGSISLPFAVSGSNRTERAAGDLRVALAETERVAFLAHLRTELLLARDRFTAAVERLRVYDGALLTGAREERQSVLSAYRNGDLTLLELLDFERALSRAETERLRAAIDVTTSYAEIFITLSAPSGLSPHAAGSGDSND